MTPFSLSHSKPRHVVNNFHLPAALRRDLARQTVAIWLGRPTRQILLGRSTRQKPGGSPFVARPTRVIQMGRSMPPAHDPVRPTFTCEKKRKRPADSFPLPRPLSPTTAPPLFVFLAISPPPRLLLRSPLSIATGRNGYALMPISAFNTINPSLKTIETAWKI